MRAADLFESGWSNRDIAEALGCDVSSVCGWRRKLEAGGRDALRSRPHPGKPSKLSQRQRTDLLRRLEAGPQSQGFPGQLWTCPRIAALIERRCGVVYHVDSLPRLLDALGFSCQRPQKKPAERDEAKIGAWVAKDWPRIKKRPAGSGRRSRSLIKRGF